MSDLIRLAAYLAPMVFIIGILHLFGRALRSK
ncbi:UNVERIFIED_ORG: hypothetical protein M2438_002512 [Methylobacterium sp. SuP10 SLI 274]|nr:hypothetical protein [Methylorubrum extorquens]MDF9792048.1 hypothetical protein [Methylorubrum extorquens]MDF9863737.1 hypothetical protein [Methylorubrum pseudosasae]MDH6637337.1 hypothetical protein [Methylobacterium sp. SuP10 SLI 274]MDH6666517.1 hypothetical protein [Methylorubrum zatmanii]